MSPLDDRGRAFEVCEPAALPLNAAAAVRKSVAWAHGVRRSTMLRSAVVSILFWAAYFSFVKVGPSFVFGILVFAISEVIGLFYARSMRERRNEDARNALLKYGLCAACAYDLAEIPAAPDGCCVCPECGHAWRLP